MEDERLVIALRYEGEEEYRYLVSSDMSWQHLDYSYVYFLDSKSKRNE